MSLAIIAVIPARGGSKRIPAKNIRCLAGKPLISYTIAAAASSGLFERVIVTTDRREIADIAVDCGAEVPFLRNASLADDMTPVSEATVDALARVDPDGSACGVVAQLMPNCPLRNGEDIVASHRSFESSCAESQISVVRYGWQNPWWAMRRDEQCRLEPLFTMESSARSQDLPELFCPTGAIWWARAEALRSAKTFHLKNRTGWEIPWQRGIDIDTFDDWAMAEVLMNLAQRECPGVG